MDEVNTVSIVSTSAYDFASFIDSSGDLQQEEAMFVYPSFQFERPIYLFIWETLVIIATIVNGLVIAVFSRKKMWSPTNVILTSIAVTDTLTGLVTLPSYIMVYQKYISSESGQQPYDGLEESFVYEWIFLSNGTNRVILTLDGTNEINPFWPGMDEINPFSNGTKEKKPFSNVTNGIFDLWNATKENYDDWNGTNENNSTLDGWNYPLN